METIIAGVPFAHPVMNGAGVCKQLNDRYGFYSFTELLASASAAVEVGSITKEPRVGNGGSNFSPDPIATQNTLGLPNCGIRTFAERELPEMARLATEAGKPLIVNVAGFSPNESAELAAACLELSTLVVVNLGCPNVHGKDGQKPIVSYDLELVRETLFQLNWHCSRRPGTKIGIKLSPVLDFVLLNKIAEAINRYSSLVKFVTTSNTVPNTLDYGDNGQPRIQAEAPGASEDSPKINLAGMSGPALKPIALGQVRQLRGWLKSEIDIIGVGGISTARDVHDYLRAGAKAVQITSALLTQGPHIFEKILAEL